MPAPLAAAQCSLAAVDLAEFQHADSLARNRRKQRKIAFAFLFTFSLKKKTMADMGRRDRSRMRALLSDYYNIDESDSATASSASEDDATSSSTPKTKRKLNFPHFWLIFAPSLLLFTPQ